MELTDEQRAKIQNYWNKVVGPMIMDQLLDDIIEAAVETGLGDDIENEDERMELYSAAEQEFWKLLAKDAESQS